MSNVFKNKKINLFFAYFAIIFYLETLFKIYKYGHVFNVGTIYMFSFSFVIALILSLVTTIFNERVNKVLYYVITSFITFLFLVQFVFSGLFSTLFSFASIGLADQAVDFFGIVIEFLFQNWWWALLFLVPIILSIVCHKIVNFRRADKTRLIINMCAIASMSLISLIIMIPGKDKLYSAYEFYFKRNDATLAGDKLGVLTTMSLDLTRWITGFEEELIFNGNDSFEESNNPEIEYNELNINFEEMVNSETKSSLKNLAQYMTVAEKTNKNEYTGMFKGKNLIFILAEGFNEIAVDKDLTPTLYQLTHEGFIFNNFYSPVFLSTTGGEFQAMTGLIPTQEILTTWKRKGNNLLFSLGHAFNNLEYNVNAYHNWTYSYYSRQVTMPSLGFNNYLACWNGLENHMNCRKWPTSDIELINSTSKMYISNEENFMTYYITLSGHANYNFGGNYIAAKNKELVNHLDYSTTIKAYLATQIELDRALAILINDLKEAGVLDDTVIALVGDHYPYTIDIDTINEIATYKKDGIVEVNKSNFIIWNNTMESVVIDKVGSQIDVLPTLLNLFGIDYDSRMMVGKDILSDSEGLAIFSNRSWVSDKGTYFANKKTFVPKENVEVEDGYVERINNKIANKYAVSKLLIDNDYYNYILNK
ncbi:MAG: hypothetical protein E7173_03595 [Firmicutes bacterium]|nr:hypothetical protein [Bacillota bacterium]